MAQDLRALIREKIDFLDKALVLETDASKQFKLQKEIETLKAQLAETKTQILTRLPQMEDALIGREAVLEEMHQKLNRQNQVLLMNGMGGIGKTALAMTYAQSYQSEYDYVVWIEQVGMDFPKALLSEPTLLMHLDYQATENTEADACNILSLLGTKLKGKGLLLLDNMEADFKNYKDYLPRTNWHILLTSRERLYGAKYRIRLGFLKPDAARTLFYEHYLGKRDDVLVDDILKKVDYHTLSVELFAKTIQSREKSLAWLQQRLEARGLAIGISAKDVELQYRATAQTLEKIFPYLSAMFDASALSQEQLQLLQQLCCLPPQPYSDEELCYYLALEKESEAHEELSLHRNQLSKKGWLIKEADTWKLHRVLQDVIWAKAKPKWEAIEKLVEQVANLLDYAQDKDNPIHKFPFVEYGDFLVERVKEWEKEEVSYLMDCLRQLYADLGQYERAKDLGENALTIAQAIFDIEHETIAVRQSNLANLYRELGNYEEAADLLETTLKSDIENFGEQHPRAATHQSNLALVYRDLGRYGEAADLLETALKSDIENFGEQHPSVVISQSNLALVYQDLVRYEEAAELLEVVLKSNIENFGEQHPRVAISQSNLAAVYGNLGRYAEAADLLEVALKSDIENFGEQHPQVAIKQSNLANVYRELERYMEAAELLEAALKSDIINFGEQHPQVAIKQSNLALVYGNLGRYVEAADLLEAALKSDIENFGEQHPTVATRFNNLAHIFVSVEKYETGIEAWFKALEILQYNFG